MIDGLYPSQMMEIEKLKTSHYRNIKQIVNKHNHWSFFSQNFIQISRRKKQNHDNWRTFNNMVTEETRYKKNVSLYHKLQKISLNRSRYAIKTEPSSPSDPLLHHNYLYEFHRKHIDIEKNNQMIASRIINIKGDINKKKQESQFRANKFNVSRLQKFERHKRLNRLVTKSLNQKFDYTASRMSLSKSSTQQDPQSF